eukprot:1728618-Amphidinium_carterae.1
MRLEYMERIRRKCEETHQERVDAGLPSEYKVEQPWDKVFKEAARDATYWNEEVDRKILLVATKLRETADVMEDGIKDVGEMKNKKRGGGEYEDREKSPLKRRQLGDMGPRTTSAKRMARPGGGSKGGGCIKGKGKGEARGPDGRHWVRRAMPHATDAYLRILLGGTPGSLLPYKAKWGEGQWGAIPVRGGGVTDGGRNECDRVSRCGSGGWE